MAVRVTYKEACTVWGCHFPFTVSSWRSLQATAQPVLFTKETEAMAEGFDLEGEFSSMQTTTQIMFGTPTDLVLQATSLFEEQLNDIQTMTPALFATER